MNNNQLARKARRQAFRSYRRGEIDSKTYTRVHQATQDDAILTEWNARIKSAQLNPWEHTGVLMTSVKGFDFSNIWDWFSKNWPEILKMLLMVLPLFLGESNEDPLS